MAAKPIDWASVRRVLVVRLRSIGDTVLATPSLIALRRFLPEAKIDVVLEDWVAPVLDGLEEVDEIISIPTERTPSPDGKLSSRAVLAIRGAIAWKLREKRYDVAFNLHGGTTATLITRLSGARYRVGLSDYQYSFLHNRRLTSLVDYWGSDQLHSAEQQLAVLGHVGVPVADRPKSRLAVTPSADASVTKRLNGKSSIALLHPGTAFATKQWPVKNFARVAEFLESKGLQSVAIASVGERATLGELNELTTADLITFDDLTLPEITALASKAAVFVGNDSGIAHIAAAVNTPSVVIFGSSNRVHWRPWTVAPNEIVFNEFHCQPCAGYECKEFGTPRCILEVPPSAVFTALERVLAASESLTR